MLNICRSGPTQGILPFRLRGHWHVARVIVEDSFGQPMSSVEVLRIAHRSAATYVRDLVEEPEERALARFNGLLHLLRIGRVLCRHQPGQNHDRRCEERLDPSDFVKQVQRRQRVVIKTCFVQQNLPSEAWAIALTAFMAEKPNLTIDGTAAAVSRLSENVLMRFIHHMLEASNRDSVYMWRMFLLAFAELEAPNQGPHRQSS